MATVRTPPSERRSVPRRRPSSRCAWRQLLLLLGVPIISAAAVPCVAAAVGGQAGRDGARGATMAGGDDKAPWLLLFPTPVTVGSAVAVREQTPPLLPRVVTPPSLVSNVQDPEAADGRRGVCFRLEDNSVPLVVPRGHGVCYAPVDLPEMAAQLKGLDDAATRGRTYTTLFDLSPRHPRCRRRRLPHRGCHARHGRSGERRLGHVQRWALGPVRGGG